MTSIVLSKVPTMATASLMDGIRLNHWAESEGISDPEFITALKKIGAVDELRIPIDSDGGSCDAMQAIVDAIQKHPAKKVITHILGKAYSAAGIVFLAGHERLMAPDSWFMMHGARGRDGIKTASSQKWDVRIQDFIHKRTGIDKDTIRKMSDAETYLCAADCLKCGICTSIAGEPLPQATRPELPAAVRRKHDWEVFEQQRKTRRAQVRRHVTTSARPISAFDRMMRARRERVSGIQPQHTSRPRRPLIPLPLIPPHLRGKIFMSFKDYLDAAGDSGIRLSSGQRAVYDAANRRMASEGYERLCRIQAAAMQRAILAGSRR